jgi:hypothetical protein
VWGGVVVVWVVVDWAEVGWVEVGLDVVEVGLDVVEVEVGAKVLDWLDPVEEVE